MKRLRKIGVYTVVIFLLLSCTNNRKSEGTKGDANVKSFKTLLIDQVWAANRVRFALQTVGDKQFVAYYNRNRMMTVASRQLDSDQWSKVVLNNKLRWDSHNYVVLAIDKKGYIHVSGNMHVDPLIYYRSTKPYDIKSLVRVKQMVGEYEEDVTYPKFFYSYDNDLLYSYRSGSCGNGVIFINRFDSEKLSWERFSDQPLFDGIEENNNRAAYHRFVRDKDGVFHYTWIWRWTPEVATSHQICYARTTDMIHWESASGEKLELPFKPDDPRVIVDPTPSEGGMTNARFGLILTPDQQPIIGYVKYDEQGLTQMYLACFINGEWMQSKISDWDFRWKFIGGGDQMTIGGQFDFRGYSESGLLVIDWETETGKSGTYVVDPFTLKKVDKKPECLKKYPDEIWTKISENPDLHVRISTDQGSGNVGEKYLLKWETMPSSHGRHAPEVIPSGPLSQLLLLTISE